MDLSATDTSALDFDNIKSEAGIPPADPSKKPKVQALDKQKAEEDGADSSDDGFPDPVDPTEAKTEAEESEFDKELHEAKMASLLEELTRQKEIGNGYFKTGANAEAIAAYGDGINAAVEGLANKSDQCKPVLISLYSNSAAAQLKLSEWKAAEESASSALALDSTNSKCLFRRGVARSKLNMLSSAKDDLMAACRADPKDRNARTELAAVQEALKVQKASEKMSFAEKFGAATERAVAKEEAKEAAKRKEEEAKAAAEEAALREEWKAECARLREVQREQRETARLARLRKFLVQDAAGAEGGGAAADISDGSAPSGSGAETASPAARDVSRFAREELRWRLEAIEVEEDDVIISPASGSVASAVVSGGSAGGVRNLKGWASVTPTEKGSMPLFEYGFELAWKVMGRSDCRTIGSGTLTYSNVTPCVLIGDDEKPGSAEVEIGDVSETINSTDGQVNPATPPGRIEAEKSRTAAALVTLKGAIQTALNEFAFSLANQPVEGMEAAETAAAAAESQDVVAAAATRAEEEPITFKAFKEAREKAAKEAKELEEENVKKAKEAAEAERRRARKAERVKVNDEDLAGMKGYKTRADGSKTSYFTREVDAETKALLDAQKAPKKLDSSPQAERENNSTSAGSAWNTGGTWEEKDMTSWVKSEIEEKLKAVTASFGTCSAIVSKVKDVEGSASVVASRGNVRHLYELAFEVEYKVTSSEEAEDGGGDGAEKKKATSVCKGALKYTEVGPSKTTGTVQIGDVSHEYKSHPTAANKPTSLAIIDALKMNVEAALGTFDADYKTSKRL